MSEREQASAHPLALLRAGALGAALAAAACVTARALGWGHALQASAAGLLALAVVAGVLGRRGHAPTAVPAGRGGRSLRALAACTGAGAVLWAWPAAAALQITEREPGVATFASSAARTWLCGSSLLATPYQRPRARVLNAAEGSRAVQLEACAREHAKTGSHVVAQGAARALARTRATARYDLVLVGPSTPAHPLPLGMLPVASAPLETVEGIRDLLGALAPEGMLAAFVVGEPLALRWVHTVRGAMAALDLPHPERHLVVYGAAGAYAVLARRTPFDMDSVLAMHDGQRRALPDVPPDLQGAPAWLRTQPKLLATPGSAFDNRFAAEVTARDPGRSADGYAFDIHAATDDRPLFYEITRRDRPDTWTSGTSYRVVSWLLALVTLAAAAIALWAARGRDTSAGMGPPLRLIGGYGGLALAHGLGYACAQHYLALWLPVASHAPALCSLVLVGSAAVWLALRPLEPRPRTAAGFALQLTGAAALALVARATAPSTQLTAGMGAAGLAGLSLLALAALGSLVALATLEMVRVTPLAVRRRALSVYVAWLAPAVVLGPALVLASGHHTCALAAAVALAAASVLAPAQPRA